MTDLTDQSESPKRSRARRRGYVLAAMALVIGSVIAFAAWLDAPQRRLRLPDWVLIDDVGSRCDGNSVWTCTDFARVRVPGKSAADVRHALQSHYDSVGQLPCPGSRFDDLLGGPAHDDGLSLNGSDDEVTGSITVVHACYRET